MGTNASVGVIRDIVDGLSTEDPVDCPSVYVRDLQWRPFVSPAVAQSTGVKAGFFYISIYRNKFQ
jgi:hypothetical protein